MYAVGPLLQELQSLTSKQEGAAKDVAGMAGSALELQATLATLCDAMSLALPAMRQVREGVAIQHALPAAVAKELQVVGTHRHIDSRNMKNIT